MNGRVRVSVNMHMNLCVWRTYGLQMGSGWVERVEQGEREMLRVKRERESERRERQTNRVKERNTKQCQQYLN